MNLTELIGELSRHLEQSGDLDVFVTWEGTFSVIEPSNIYVAKPGTVRALHKTLLIDADDNFYKREFAEEKPGEGR